LQVTANRDVLVVIGEAADLPWVDGIEYAYKSAEAPALWLPTQWRPDVSPDLLFRALQLAHQRQPLLLWHAPAAVVPLDRQLPLGPGVLEMIAARWEGR
jgi:hypothetical protein